MSNIEPGLTLPDKPLFLLTIDTEEEWDWNGDFPRSPFSTSNIEQIPDFQQFCGELGIRPTYFVDHAVANSDTAVTILKQYFDSGECDVGAHLHPWANPPMLEPADDFHSHAVNLPLSSFESKINVLTKKLQSCFGAHPYSYRAGRWGVNADHLKILATAGYKVDSSVRPFYKDKYFSYENAQTKPYWPSFDDVLSTDASQKMILELPTTSGYNLSKFEILDRLHSKLSTAPLNKVRLIGILWQLGIVRKITVTPEGHDAGDICRCIDAAVKRGDKVISMFFHSSDLLPGCTQYVRSDADKRKFLDCIKSCILHMKHKHNADFVTMREVRKKLNGTV